MNSVLKWAGCALVCLGALCTSLRLDPLNIWLLNAGALVYLIWSLRIRESNLIVVNAVLLALYVVGLIYTPEPAVKDAAAVTKSVVSTHN